MSKESEKYLREDNIEENKMLDNLDWVLKFMKNYEKKKEKLEEYRKISASYF
jgi:hypothetical protein